MSRVCQLTGKRTTAGKNKPFSQKRTCRTFRPNLFTKRVLDPITGQVRKLKLSAKAIRTLKKWSREALAAEEATTTTSEAPKTEKAPKAKKKEAKS